MLTLTTMLKAMRQRAEYGELHVAVPRDHAPASYYAERRRREEPHATDEPLPGGAHVVTGTTPPEPEAT